MQSPMNRNWASLFLFLNWPLMELKFIYFTGQDQPFSSSKGRETITSHIITWGNTVIPRRSRLNFLKKERWWWIKLLNSLVQRALRPVYAHYLCNSMLFNFFVFALNLLQLSSKFKNHATSRQIPVKSHRKLAWSRRSLYKVTFKLGRDKNWSRSGHKKCAHLQTSLKKNH